MGLLRGAPDALQREARRDCRRCATTCNGFRWQTTLVERLADNSATGCFAGQVERANPPSRSERGLKNCKGWILRALAQGGVCDLGSAATWARLARSGALKAVMRLGLRIGRWHGRGAWRALSRLDSMLCAVAVAQRATVANAVGARRMLRLIRPTCQGCGSSYNRSMARTARTFLRPM